MRGCDLLLFLRCYIIKLLLLPLALALAAPLYFVRNKIDDKIKMDDGRFSAAAVMRALERERERLKQATMFTAAPALCSTSCTPTKRCPAVLWLKSSLLLFGVCIDALSFFAVFCSLLIAKHLCSKPACVGGEGTGGVDVIIW